MLEIPTNKPQQLSGSCLCGGVRYTINGPMRDVVNCFCSECRKTSGHYVAASRINKDHLQLMSDETLKWYEFKPNILRGFCERCGGNLFWHNLDEDDNGISVMAGSLDAPTNLKTIGNIHTEDASDYCEIPVINTKSSDLNQ